MRNINLLFIKKESFQTIKAEANVQGSDYDEVETHVENYHGFTKVVTYGTGSVIVLLILMAIFLL